MPAAIVLLKIRRSCSCRLSSDQRKEEIETEIRSQALDGQSVTQLSHKALPERVRLPDARIAGLFPDRRVDHDEPAGRIDVDRLATDAGEPEHPPLTRQYPDLIAVAAGTGLRLPWVHTRGLLDPGRRDDLSPAPVPVVGEQQS